MLRQVLSEDDIAQLRQPRADDDAAADDESPRVRSARRGKPRVPHRVWSPRTIW
jgi:hypothetical protein